MTRTTLAPLTGATPPPPPPGSHAPGHPSRSRGFGTWTYTLLRIGAGLLFMQHGAQKIFGTFGGLGGSGATAEWMSQMAVAGMLEFFGGLLIVLGLITRPLAVVLFLEMLVAYFLAHAPQGGWPIENQGEMALLYALIFLCLAGNGAGPVSLDARFHQRRQPRH